MLEDIKRIFVKAGKGGDAIISKKKHKGTIKNRGGKGGDIIFRVSKKVHELERTKNIIADDGKVGRKNKKGKDARKTIVSIPENTKILSKDKKYTLYNFKSYKEEAVILRGGKGGNTEIILKYKNKKSLKYYNKGEIGKEICICIDMRLISKIGIIGLPNTGKSTLLSKLTSANPKISDYNFTTLKPSLGFLKNKIIAEIPGICSNAHLGYGIGIEFLKHLEKCNMVIHIIETSSNNILNNIAIIKKEINYFINLIEKEEIIVLSKIDLISYREILKKKKSVDVLAKYKTLLCSKAIFHSLEKIKHKLITKLSF